MRKYSFIYLLKGEKKESFQSVSYDASSLEEAVELAFPNIHKTLDTSDERLNSSYTSLNREIELFTRLVGVCEVIIRRDGELICNDRLARTQKLIKKVMKNTNLVKASHELIERKESALLTRLEKEAEEYKSFIFKKINRYYDILDI